ncbi:MAG: tyrosine--tRNA ligase [Metamycoplasmataceae bacterium]
MKKEDVLKELEWRGILNNITDKNKLIKNANSNLDYGIYIGFDPSFKSLHLGNYVQIRILKIFKKYGWKTVALIGGATGMIGDPSGKKSERKLLDAKEVHNNIKGIETQLIKYVDDPTMVFNNELIWSNMNVIEYLREIGKMFMINRMLEKDIVKSRLDSGISYSEFSYSLLQSYDWLYLLKKHNVALQCGGSDQWGNITAGIDMIRKSIGENHQACGLTINLLLKSDGTKFGKSESGAIYLDPAITSPYAMYHFLINQNDNDLEQLFKFFTDYSQKEIQQIIEEHKNDPKKRYGQKELTKSIMIDIHGEKEYLKCQEMALLFFEEKYLNIPENILTSVFDEKNRIKITWALNENLIDILERTKLFKSKGEIRDLIKSKGLSINGNLINNEKELLKQDNIIHNKFLVLKKGKKNFFLLEK